MLKGKEDNTKHYYKQLIANYNKIKLQYLPIFIDKLDSIPQTPKDSNYKLLNYKKVNLVSQKIKLIVQSKEVKSASQKKGISASHIILATIEEVKIAS